MEQKKIIKKNNVCNYLIATTIVLLAFFDLLSYVFSFVEKVQGKMDAVLSERAVQLGGNAFLTKLFSPGMLMTMHFFAFVIVLIVWANKSDVKKRYVINEEAKCKIKAAVLKEKRKKKEKKKKKIYINWGMMFCGFFSVGIVTLIYAFLGGFLLTFLLTIISFGGAFFNVYEAANVLEAIAVIIGGIGALYGGGKGAVSRAYDFKTFWDESIKGEKG